MALNPAPSLAPPVVRQQSVVQLSAPARETQIALPLQSLTTSRVLIVVFSTISGGAKSHIPSSKIWVQVPLIGTGGYARFGNTLVSAWLSRPGIAVYQAGSFRFAGLVGLAPEYSTSLIFELEECQDGIVDLSQQSWDETYVNVITAQAPAAGQKVRGVLAVGFAEGQHQFLDPGSDQKVLTQTAVSGFYTSPFSVVGSYSEQLSNDDSDVSLPFDGLSSPSGVLLFSVARGSQPIESVELTHGTTAFVSYPGQSFTLSSAIGLGGVVTSSSDTYIQFEAMTTMASLDSMLFGEPVLTQTVGTQLFAAVIASGTVDAYIDAFNFVAIDSDAMLLGTIVSTITTDTKLVAGDEKSHLTDSLVHVDARHFTDSYIYAGQTSSISDSLLQSTSTLTHTTTAAMVVLNTSTITTDSYLQPTLFIGTITTDAVLDQDNIIGMTGWELKDIFAECDPILTPSYTPNPNTLVFVSTSAKRPSSQGVAGLRIDNNTVKTSYWFISQTSRSLADLAPTTEWPRLASQTYRETWATLYFRCNNLPTTGSETLIADGLSQIDTGPGIGGGSGGGGGIGGGGTIISGYCYWLTLGALTLGGGGGGLQLGKGEINLGNVSSSYSLTDSNWHLLEVRTYKATNTTLNAASSGDPVIVEIYLDYDLILSMNSPYPCNCDYALGCQERLTGDHFQVDYDDFIVSTNRLTTYDLSVIAKPAKAAGTYAEWTGTPSNTFADVASIPYDVAKYYESSGLNQRQTFKVYSGGDANPYPGKIHAVSMQFVHNKNANSINPNMALLIREGTTDVIMKTWRPHIGLQSYVGMASTTSRSPVAGLAWEAAIYDFEIGVKQVTDTGVNRVVGVYANMLVSPFSNFITTDSLTAGTVTTTHTTSSSVGVVLDIFTDAVLTGFGGSFTADSSIVSFMSAEHAIDAAAAGTVDSTYLTDAIVDRLVFNSLDSVIVWERGSSGTTDALLSGQLDTSHDADALVGILVDLPHDTNAVAYRLVLSTHLTDAAALSNPVAFHLADARKISAVTITHTTTSALKVPITSTLTTDALKHLRPDLTHTTSASKQGELSASFTVSSATAPTNVLNKSFFSNALLQITSSNTHAANALLKSMPALTFSTNSSLFGSSAASHACDSWIVIPAAKTLTHLATSSLSGEATATFSGTSLLKTTPVSTGTTNAWLQLVGQIQHATDALLLDTRSKSHLADSVLAINPVLTITADSLLKLTVTNTHTGSSALIAEPTAISLSTSILSGSVDMTVTSNALLKVDLSLTHTTNAATAFEKLFSANSYLALGGDRYQNVASSLFGSSQALHTTSILVYAQLSALHLLSSSLQSPIELTHTTTGNTFGSTGQTHTTELLAARDKDHNVFANTSGTGGSDNLTNSFLVNDDRGVFEDNQNGVFDGAF